MGTSLLAVTTPFYSAYAGSKSALEHFTRALAKELGHRGVTVNTVAPGPIDTSFFHGQESKESVEMFTNMTPAKRLGLVEDVLPVVEFLVSDKAKWVNAQTIFVNGALITR
ncbi:NAD(P)-binding protein [Neoconidiobolus thromboides FSU 785]|nr:NAD(P)-binding protein [Neoconidiobolus thromboides FSU 785]